MGPPNQRHLPVEEIVGSTELRAKVEPRHDADFCLNRISKQVERNRSDIFAVQTSADAAGFNVHGERSAPTKIQPSNPRSLYQKETKTKPGVGIEKSVTSCVEP